MADPTQEKLHRNDRDRAKRPDLLGAVRAAEQRRDEDDRAHDEARDKKAATRLAAVAATQAPGKQPSGKQPATKQPAAKQPRRGADAQAAAAAAEAERKAAELAVAEQAAAKAEEERRAAAHKASEAARAREAAQRAAAAAADLHKAMSGMGTNEAKIFATLRGKTAAEIKAIKAAYQAQTGHSLEADLADEMDGNDLKMAKALLAQDPVQAKVAALQDAMDGWGTDEDKVKETLASIKDPAQRRQVAAEYEKTTGHSLNKVLADEGMQAEGVKPEQFASTRTGPQADPAAAKKLAASKDTKLAASAILAATDRWGTDERAVFAALAGKSPAEIAAIKAAFQQHSGESLDEVLERELSDTHLKEAKALLSGDPVQIAVAQLHNATDGVGTDRTKVHDTLKGIADPTLRAQVQAEYERQTGETLDAMLAREMTGFDKDVAQAYLEGNQAKIGAVKADQAMHGGFVTSIADGISDMTGLDRARLRFMTGNGLGTDNQALYEQLEAAKNDQERKALLDAYKARTGHELLVDLDKDLEGKEKDVGKYLVAGDQTAAEAAKMAAAAYGVGTDKKAIYAALQKAKTQEERAALLKKYDELYGKDATFQQMIASELGELDQAKAKQLAAQGKMDDGFAVYYAMNEGMFGIGTDDELLKEKLAGKTKGELAELRKSYAAAAQTYGGKANASLDTDVEGDTSGRLGHELKQALKGPPETIDELRQRAKEDYEFERTQGGWIGEAGLMATMGPSYAAAKAMGMSSTDVANAATDLWSGSGERLDRTHAEIELRYAQIKADPKYADYDKYKAGSPERKAMDQAMLAELQGTVDWQAGDLKGFQDAKDATANAASTAVSIAVGAVVAIASGGTAAPAVIALISGIAGVSTKMLIQGGAMSNEELVQSLASVIAEAVAAGAVRLKTIDRLIEKLTTLVGNNHVLLGKIMEEAVEEAFESRTEEFLNSLLDPSLYTGDLAYWATAVSERTGKALFVGGFSGGVAAGVGHFVPGGKKWYTKMAKGAATQSAGSVATAAITPSTYEGSQEEKLARLGQSVGEAALRGARDSIETKDGVQFDVRPEVGVPGTAGVDTSVAGATGVDTSSDARVDAKVDAKVDTTADATAHTKVDTTVDTKADATAHVKTEATAGLNAAALSAAASDPTTLAGMWVKSGVSIESLQDGPTLHATLEAHLNDVNLLQGTARGLLLAKGIDSPTQSQLDETMFQLSQALKAKNWQFSAPFDPGSLKREDGINERLGNVFYEKRVFTPDQLQAADLMLSPQDATRLTGGFESGLSGMVLGATFINTPHRAEGDFSRAYGEGAWGGFAKAHSYLDSIPRGQFIDELNVDTVLAVNKQIHAPDTGITAQMLRAVSAIGRGFQLDEGGELRQGRQFARPEHYSDQEMANLREAGVNVKQLTEAEDGGKAMLEYPRPEEVRPRLERLIEKLKQDLAQPDADPIAAASAFQRHFVALHPFGDSNGRTSRVLMNRILAEFDLPPAILADQNRDISLSPEEWRDEVAKGIARSKEFLTSKQLESKDDYLGKMGIQAIEQSPNKPITIGGNPFDLGKDGLLYDPTGRPWLVENNEVIPLAQLEHYVMSRRILQAGKDAGNELLKTTTAATRALYEKIAADPEAAKDVVVRDDARARQADMEYSLAPDPEVARLLTRLTDVGSIDPAAMFTIEGGTGNGTAASATLSKYAQIDLELWYVERGLRDGGHDELIAEVRANRAKLFEAARAALVQAKDPTRVSAENPMGFRYRYEHMMFEKSPLRFATLDQAIKQLGDGKMTVWRGDYSFARLAGMAPNNDIRQPDAKAVADQRAEKNQITNLYDDLVKLEGSAMGRQYICTTTDLALLTQNFAGGSNSREISLAGLPSFVKGPVINWIAQNGPEGISQEDIDKLRTTAVERGDSVVPGPQGGKEIKDAFGIPGTIVTAQIVDKEAAKIQVTAPRKAFQLVLDKDALLPGIYSLGGPMFEAEQEVHGLERVNPWSIKAAHEATSLTEEFPVVGAQPETKPQPESKPTP